VAVAALDALLVQRRQLSEARVAAFSKRLGMQAAYLPTAGALAVLVTIHTLFKVARAAVSSSPQTSHSPDCVR
jgi:hypothetical protein